MRAPLIGALFAVELTGDLDALQSLVAATVAAYAVTVLLLLRRSMLTEKIIARRGQHITREYGVDPYELIRVGEVMARDVDVLPIGLPISEAVSVLEGGRHRIYPVLDDARRPVGLVSRTDALHWRVEGAHGGETLGDHASLTVVHPGDVVSHAVDLMLCQASSSSGGSFAVAGSNPALSVSSSTESPGSGVNASGSWGWEIPGPAPRQLPKPLD